MKEVKALTSEEILGCKNERIPDFVIESVNELLIGSISTGKSTTILQKDIVAEIIKRNPDTNSREIYDKRWLDFEQIFRNAGWNVYYDKPRYNESYEAKFEFSVKK